jgi:transposase
LEQQLKPRLEEAKAGKRHVFFVDAMHCVFGTFLCCLWSYMRVCVRAASGRQRFNVLGAWDAVAGTLTCVCNTTVVNTEIMCELLRKVAAQGLTQPITMVLDNARYQRNQVVMALAAQLNIELLFLPSYSPNLNLIERLWRFIKRHALYGRWHANFSEFKQAVEKTMSELSGEHKDKLASLMTLEFQTFEEVKLLGK